MALMEDGSVIVEVEYNNDTDKEDIVRFQLDREQPIIEPNRVYDVSLIRFRIPTKNVRPFDGDLVGVPYIGLDTSNGAVGMQLDMNELKKARNTTEVLDYYNHCLSAIYHQNNNFGYHKRKQLNLPSTQYNANDRGYVFDITLSQLPTTNQITVHSINLENLVITATAFSPTGGHYQLSLIHPHSHERVILATSISGTKQTNDIGTIADYGSNVFNVRTGTNIYNAKPPVQMINPMFTSTPIPVSSSSLTLQLFLEPLGDALTIVYPAFSISGNIEMHFTIEPNAQGVPLHPVPYPATAPYLSISEDTREAYRLKLNYSDCHVTRGMKLVANQAATTLIPFSSYTKYNGTMMDSFDTSNSVPGSLYQLNYPPTPTKRKADGTYTVNVLNTRSITNLDPTPNAFNNIDKLLLHSNLDIIPEILSSNLRGFDNILTDILVEQTNPENYNFVQNDDQNRKYRFVGNGSSLNISFRPMISRKDGSTAPIMAGPGEYGSMKFAFYPAR